MSTAPSFSVLLYTKDSQPVAHCLELDFVTTSYSAERALADLCELIRDQILAAARRDTLKHLFQPAPLEYWEHLAHARLTGERIVVLSRDPTLASLCVEEVRLREFTCAQPAKGGQAGSGHSEQDARAPGGGPA